MVENMTTLPHLIIPHSAIESSLKLLQEAGHERKERVLLWLAARHPPELIIQEVYLPRQQCELDSFWIPREGMEELHVHLRKHSLMVAAQIHNHPFEAFHSLADDRWAIIRHIGALSLVLAHFALRSSVESFDRDVVIYSLSSSNRWVKVPQKECCRYYRIVS